MKDGLLPSGLTDRTDLDDALEDVERARGTTMEERAQILESLCRMASELVAQQTDPQRALDWRDPPAPDTETILRTLRERHRQSHRG